MKIILASHNLHKVEEMKTVLRDLSVEIITLDDYPEVGDIEETGETLEENALLKARTVNRITGIPAIGDDTGLEVDSLDGGPGVYSARYAGEHATYEDNINKLLAEMSDMGENERTARFRTVAAFVDGETELTSEGKIEGMITFEPKGMFGFGYDPLFFIPEMNCTFAELSAEEKNKISHRGHALRNLYKHLSALWSSKL
ncbi:MAG: XTP/dITP diphosphatase [Candidatus Marinimicrobia bacterium]|nr:XTP/dITP diphosphatase [Candidatus Neomarinimicrobiota bacterium]MCH7764110.1 XTP/dITP diphosphatase [Candidatus Neomarinimicrobiota bacterium]